MYSDVGNVGDGHTTCDPTFVLPDRYAERSAIQLAPLEEVLGTDLQVFLLKVRTPSISSKARGALSPPDSSSTLSPGKGCTHSKSRDSCHYQSLAHTQRVGERPAPVDRRKLSDIGYGESSFKFGWEVVPSPCAAWYTPHVTRH